MRPSQKFHHCTIPGVSEATHRMAYYCWGEPQARYLVICVHGFTRQARDFDVLAGALAQKGIFVVATDVVGRGASDWLDNAAHYQIASYVAHHISLLNQLTAGHHYEKTAWVGTSMGGLIGLGVCASAAMHLAPRIDKLVLNDVGPRIEAKGLAHLSSYVGRDMRFADEAAAIAHLAKVSVGFGAHSAAEWRALCLPMLRPEPAGGVRLHYDPRIANALTNASPELQAQGEALLWQSFAKVQARILLLHGAESDILSRETVVQMQSLQPTMQTLVFAQAGHAPTLVHEGQIAPVVRFILGDTHESSEW